ncbi:MAG: hypothetical protein V2J89_17415, partial [Halieaceae bacterium]|nr:hypothetical protein [Halieaceae bacterium]
KRPEQKLAIARALTEQGDWLLWHGAREEAMSSYDKAYMELVDIDGAEEELASMFGEPRALPALEGIDHLPRQAGAPGDSIATLEFDVSERGQVLHLDRLDDNDAIDGRTNRLMRELRKTVFRPRIVDGKPVPTEGVVRNYVIADGD